MRFERKRGIYEKYIKRVLDIICALLALLVFFWLYIILAVIIRINLGSPVIFRQPRPGMIDPKTGRERIFYLYKFRSMTNERDAAGNLLPDEQRMTLFSRKIRASSLDELPSVFNILVGNMSVIGPRPQLVRDMVFMTDAQRMRHTAKPGLSGLAQVMGRNSISWEEKLNWDLKYIEHITFWGDLKLILLTAKNVLFHKAKDGQNPDTDLAPDLGDELLNQRQISQHQYDELQEYARDLLKSY